MTSQAPANAESYLPTIDSIFPSEPPSNFSELSMANQIILQHPLDVFNRYLFFKNKRHLYSDAQITGLSAIELFEERFQIYEEAVFESAFDKAVAKWAEETNEEKRKEQSEKGFDVGDWLQKLVAEGCRDIEAMNGNFRRLRNILNRLDFGEAKEPEDDSVLIEEELEKAQEFINGDLEETFAGLELDRDATSEVTK